MSYSRTNWISGETPLSAGNMNNIEEGIEEINTNLGKTISVDDTTVSVPSSGTGNKILQTVTLQPGKYIFIAMVAFDANTSGMRGVSISTNTTVQNPYYVSIGAPSTGSAYVQMVRLVDLLTETVFRVIGRQTSGSNLSATTHSSIVRLK